MNVKSWLAVVVLGLLSAACSGGEEQAGPRPSSPATVVILEPEAGAVVSDQEFTVRIELEGGEIVDETSRDLTPTEGHLHVSVDGRVVTQTYGLTQSIEAPEAGRHILQVEFVAKDHGPFSPRILASVPFEVPE